ncbi:hypothetical protein Voc01_070190 [Virgisporangium ochraceum]|uniref:Agd3 CBM87 domain-containing protein n=2 Tax=Virgisporangium ochraceum TaxID=65505 RepID=A0A8J4EHD9_9ACTN|nr:hypothetical protein Voc01_070190 [Virgisporangium ochraceum]
MLTSRWFNRPTTRRRTVAHRRRGPIAAILLLLVSQAAVTAPAAAAPGLPLDGVASARRPAPAVPGYGAVAPPAAAPPRKLPRKPGTVAVRPGQHVRPPGRGPAGARTATVTGTDRAAVRALVVAVDAGDFGVATWRSTLDRVGAAYDVLYARTAPLVADTLVRADGTGRYNAILLTDSMLLHADGSGGYVSALSGDEWNLLWAYERDYGVRQATLYSSYGTFPEDYCLRGGSEGGVGETPMLASLTTAGAGVFDYLDPGAQIPISLSYVYLDALQSGCGAQPVLTGGGAVLGVATTSADGRERLALTFTSNQYLLQAHLLVYGLFRWASRGLFLGEHRHYLSVDVDDWFNSTDHQLADGTVGTDPGFRMSGHDAYNAHVQQNALRAAYPLANGFTMHLAYNGGDANLQAGNTCAPNGGINQLTATSRCLAGEFRWVNHTHSHPKLNFTDYPTSLAEITQNVTVANQLGLPVDATVLKTGEYSGLGVYHPDPDNDLDPPTDHGLGASNPNLLTAANDAGVDYLHGNMSFPSHVPACFNCNIVHPMQPALSVVPDWPTNVAYFSTTPAEETYFYNSFYGPNGRFPYWPTDRTYEQIVGYESDQAMTHVATGSIYTHTFHIGNLRDYGAGRTLTTDWVEAVLARYTGYYSVPLLSPTWPALAAHTAGRNAHFAALSAGVDAVYDRGAGTVTVTSPAAAGVTITGARTSGYTTYGSESTATLALAAGTPVVFTPSLLP